MISCFLALPLPYDRNGFEQPTLHKRSKQIKYKLPFSIVSIVYLIGNSLSYLKLNRP